MDIYISVGMCFLMNHSFLFLSKTGVMISAHIVPNRTMLLVHRPKKFPIPVLLIHLLLELLICHHQLVCLHLLLFYNPYFLSQLIVIHSSCFLLKKLMLYPLIFTHLFHSHLLLLLLEIQLFLYHITPVLFLCNRFFICYPLIVTM